MVSEQRITNPNMTKSVGGWTLQPVSTWMDNSGWADNNQVKINVNPGYEAGCYQTVNLTGVTTLTIVTLGEYTHQFKVKFNGNIIYTSSVLSAGTITTNIPISGLGSGTLLIYNDYTGLDAHFFYVDTVTAYVTVLANFTVNNTTPNANRDTVLFTDTSTGATSWLWDFGDGQTSTSRNPTHMYTTEGSKTVTLKINGQTTGDYVKTMTITVQDPRVLVRSRQFSVV